MCETCDVTRSFDARRASVSGSREREVDERSVIKDEIEKATQGEYSRPGRSD